MQFKGTLVGMIYKALSLLCVLVAIFTTLGMASDSITGPSEAIETAIPRIYNIMAFLAGALSLWWMGAVVDLLHKISEIRNPAPLVNAPTQATAPKKKSQFVSTKDDDDPKPYILG